MKLVMAPAPAPANARWPKDRGDWYGVLVVHRMKFWSSVYERNIDAFSAIAPTMGAGNPCRTLEICTCLSPMDSLYRDL